MRGVLSVRKRDAFARLKVHALTVINGPFHWMSSPLITEPSLPYPLC